MHNVFNDKKSIVP